MERFTLISRGRPRSDRDASEVLANLTRLFKQPPERMLSLLTSRSVIKRDLTSVAAQQYLDALQRTGLEVETRLQADRALYHAGLRREQVQAVEEGQERAPLCYEVPLKRLAALLASPPCSETLRGSDAPHYRIESHRWWLSPTFLALAALLAAPLVQSYLLQLISQYATGLWVTLAGVAALLLLLLFLPPILSVQRLLTLQEVGEGRQTALLKELFSAYPLRKRYLLEDGEEYYSLEAGRYKREQATLYDADGRLLYTLQEEVEGDDVLSSLASALRENIAALGLIDRVFHLLHTVLTPHATASLTRTKENPIYLLALCNAQGEPLGLIYKGGVGVVELRHQAIPTAHRRAVLLLTLVGLGVR